MAGRVIVYGGKGALGSSLVAFFKAKSWWVASVDIFPNEEADANVVLTPTDSWTDQEKELESKVESIVTGFKLDAVLCVAGGWAGGNAASKAFVKNSDMMWKQSVWSSVLASQLSARHLTEGGLLCMTGAKAALEGTPGMIGYGMAKAAVHQLVKSVAADNSGMPKDSTTVAILPVTLDTPMNRKFMSTADFSQWTPLDTVSQKLFEWTTDKKSRPANGSLVQVVTKDGVTSFVPTE
ncbi:dihydropteridine reductase-like [Dysidea avara]|uniref:dihydropteridine reductase-like n=1 Tax=Dysidea avara TaxID=196820 RepID=UPI00332B29B3